VSEDAVQEIALWAPPVVMARSDSTEAVVVANVLTAVLLRQRDLTRKVRVRRLLRNTSLSRSLEDACQIAVSALGPFYADNRQNIARASTSLEEAQLLSGYSRARCAQLRK
jgi:hypothetical protein